MADGTVKKIQDIAVGDKILATNPATGKTEARIVLATIITEEDKDFTEVAVETSGEISKIIATDHHPFWSPSEHAWVNAVDLRKGMTLRTDAGAVVTVDETHSLHRMQETRNLTVDGIHTYYVLAGATPILAHNSGGNVNPFPSLPNMNGMTQTQAYDTLRAHGFEMTGPTGDSGAWATFKDASGNKVSIEMANGRVVRSNI